MRLISFENESGTRIGAWRVDQYVDVCRADPQIPPSMRELLGLGEAGLKRLETAIRTAPPVASPFRFLPVVPDPQKVICVGLNYRDHARETNTQPPPEPVIFNKFPTAIRGHEDPIVLPAASSQVDYEAELVVVMGRPGRRISLEHALGYVAGYTCGHDVSARDWQKHKPGGQWLLGKTFDSFAPLGPALVTPDEVGDAGGLGIQFRLNGQVMQDSRTDQLIFGIPELISYVSSVCTICTGDVIFTGTPGGVGMARQPPVFMKPGDVAEVEIEKLGILRNPVKGE
jgi:2-keto-4-pentenoate hydratase/2-oxohepta-3-ene-1,7-dioic acid hydratase in catechol pathway